MESNGNAVREWEVDDEAIDEGGMELKLAHAGWNWENAEGSINWESSS